MRLFVFQGYHFSCVYSDLAFPGQLLKDGVQYGISHPGSSPQSGPIHLVAVLASSQKIS